MTRLPEVRSLAEHLARHLGGAGEGEEVAVAIHNPGEAGSGVIDRARNAFNAGARAVLLAVPERDLQTGGEEVSASPWGFEEAEAALAEAGMPPVLGELTLDSDEGFSRHTALFVLAPDEDDRAALRGLLATGSMGFAVRGTVGDAPDSETPLRVCIVTSELHGPMRNGGIGTSYTALAESLAADGQEVCILFVGDRSSDEPMAHWVDFYQREKSLRLEALEFEDDRRLPWQQNWIRRSHAACEWLRAEEAEGRAFDVIHYPECNGHGFHIALAKHQGRAFENTTLCVGAHSSTRWIYESAGTGFSSTAQLAQDYMEEMSIRWADLCVSPSAYLTHWMRHQGWQLPRQTIAQQNIQPQNTRTADERSDAALPQITDVRELVFFGRLEARKGLPTFCDALDLLAREKAARDLRITFLGRETLIGGQGSRQILEARAEAGDWPFEWEIISDQDQAGANAYLQGEGRVAIMPSPVDNSPNTVLECIGLRIPFLATRAGGIPELIDPRDVAQCTFYHPEMAGRPSAIREAVLRVLNSGIRPARRAASASANERAWLAWHRSVPRASSAIPSAGNPSSDPIVTLADWEGIPGAAGEFVLLSDDRTVLREGAMETLARVAEETGADLLTCYVDEFVGEVPPEEAGERFDFPVGPALLLAPFWNCFGSGPLLLRRSSWEGIRDLPVPAGGSLGDLREFLTRAVRRGLHHEVVADPLAWRRIDAPREEGDGAEPEPDIGIVRLLTADSDPALRQLLGFFLSKQRQSDEMIQEYYDLRYRVKEGYEQLSARFHDQSEWLAEREGILSQREEELERARSEAKRGKAELKELKRRIGELEGERDEPRRGSGKGLSARLRRFRGKD